MGHQTKNHLDLCKGFSRWRTCSSSWIQKVIHFHEHRQQTLLVVFMYNFHGSFFTIKLTNTSEALEPQIKHEGHHVIPQIKHEHHHVILRSSMRAIMLCVLSRWKFWTKSKNGAKAFTTLVAMQLYKISNFETQFPRCNKGSTIVLQSTSTCNFTLMVKATCKAFDKSQNPWVSLRTHCFTIGLSVSIIALATTHVFTHGTLSCKWRLCL